MFVRLTFPPLFSSLGTIVMFRTLAHDGDGGTSIICWTLYSCDMCPCRVCSTNPQYSTTSPVETDPTQRPFITPVGNPTQRTSLIILVDKWMINQWFLELTRASVGDCRVLGFSW